MFDIHCTVCDTRYLVGSRSIDSFHNTSDGPIASVRCPAGHRLIRSFRTGRCVPQPAPTATADLVAAVQGAA